MRLAIVALFLGFCALFLWNGRSTEVATDPPADARSEPPGPDSTVYDSTAYVASGRGSGAPAEPDEVDPVELRADPERDVIDAAEDERARVLARIVDDLGRPVPGATVLAAGEGWQSGWTDESGEVLMLLEAGEWELSVERARPGRGMIVPAGDGAGSVRRLTVEASAETEVELAVVRSAGLKVRLVGEDGTAKGVPTNGVTIERVGEVWASVPDPRFFKGQFQTTGLAPGEYRIANATRFVLAFDPVTVELEPGAETLVEIPVVTAMTIDLEVVVRANPGGLRLPISLIGALKAVGVDAPAASRARPVSVAAEGKTMLVTMHEGLHRIDLSYRSSSFFPNGSYLPTARVEPGTVELEVSRADGARPNPIEVSLGLGDRVAVVRGRLDGDAPRPSLLHVRLLDAEGEPKVVRTTTSSDGSFNLVVDLDAMGIPTVELLIDSPGVESGSGPTLDLEPGEQTWVVRR